MSDNKVVGEDDADNIKAYGKSVDVSQIDTGKSTYYYSYNPGEHVTAAKTGAVENDDMIQKAGVANPLLWGDKGSKAVGESIDEMYAPYISRYKEMLLFIGTSSSTLSKWGTTVGKTTVHDNWRSKSINSLFDVSNKVILIPENYSMNIAYSNNYEPFPASEIVEKMVGASDLLSEANSMLEKAQLFSRRYNNAIDVPLYKLQVWQDTASVTIPDDVKFNFNFGQAGLFNGLEEVVKPVLALTAAFSPRVVANKAGGYRLSGPVITGSRFMQDIFANMRGIVTGLKDDLGDAAKDLVNGIAQHNITAAANGALDAAIKVKSAMYRAYDSANIAGISDGDNKLATFKLANFIYGPCYVGSVNFGFDFTATDENGFPTSGFVSLSGLSMPKKATGTVVDMFGMIK